MSTPVTSPIEALDRKIKELTQNSEIEAVIFDCDGVLVDTERLTGRVWSTTVNRYGFNYSESEMLTLLGGNTNERNFEIIREATYGKLPENFEEQIDTAFLKAMQTGLEIIPDVENCLRELKLPTATATNASRENLEIKLSISGLGRYFSHQFCVEDVAAGKPAPDIYLLAARTLNVSPARSLVIEDSVVGATAGVAAGMQVLGFCRDSSEADLMQAGVIGCFDNMLQLAELFRRMQNR